MTSNITYTSSETVPVFEFQRSHTSHISSKSQSFVAVRQLFEPVNEFGKSTLSWT